MYNFVVLMENINEGNMPGGAVGVVTGLRAERPRSYGSFRRRD